MSGFESTGPEDFGGLLFGDRLFLIQANKHSPTLQNFQCLLHLDTPHPNQLLSRLRPRIPIITRQIPQQRQISTTTLLGKLHALGQPSLDHLQRQRLPAPILLHEIQRIKPPSYRHDDVTVQGGVVDPIGIFVFARDATGIEHVFVGDGAEGRFGFFSSDGFVGEGAGGDETAEVGGVVEEGGGAEGSVGGGGGCVFWEGAVVGEVEEVGDVDYNGVANLKIAQSIPPKLQPRTLLHLPLLPLRQSLLQLPRPLGLEPLHRLLQSLRLLHAFGQRQRRGKKSGERVGDGRDGEFGKRGLLGVERAADMDFEVGFGAIVAVGFEHGFGPWFEGRDVGGHGSQDGWWGGRGLCGSR
mmetsp:Transcript_5013/g.10310  ORF Transcript_5013/g.10310 Transcript_5013/m.10310 type:complete len:354 (-) Transcript_5013:131-1192(-)